MHTLTMLRFPRLFLSLGAAALLAGCTSGESKGSAKAQGRGQAAVQAEAAVITEAKADPLKVDAEGPRLAKQAAQDQKRVFFYFGAEWCGPCQELKKAFHRPGNRGTFARWELVRVDVDQMPSDQNEAFGLPFDTIPFMVKLNEVGQPVGTLGGEDFGPDPTPEHVDEVFKKFLGS